MKPVNKSEENPNTGNLGNASNPMANDNDSSNNNSLLDEKAATYLREAGNIEDMPDDNDTEEMNKELEEK